MTTMICEHVEEIRDVKPSSDGCLECLQMGDLQLCLTCGTWGAAARPRTNTPRNTSTRHIIQIQIDQSFEPGEDWRWCYVDQVMLAKLAPRE